MSSLANSAHVALAGPGVGIDNINNIPRMQGVSTSAIDNATPRKGLLSVTKVDMSNFDAAVAQCARLTTYTDVQNMNKRKAVTSTDTSCGWVQYTQGGSAGASVLGTHFAVISPMPAGATSSSKYYPPLLTTSSNSMTNNWANAIQCSGSAGSVTCSTPEAFTNQGESFTPQMASSKFASVNDEYTTPFIHKYPLPSTTPVSRDKFIQVDTNSGAMAATLYQDSERGMIDPSMETRSSYSIFNTSMTHPGSNDKDSWLKAFQSFQPVGNDEYPRPSRDISVFATNLEDHDFCAEMNEQTIINENNLACLQREWLRKGGKPTDYNYPDTRLFGSCYGRVIRK
jgi:hypothetical protein